MTRELSIVRLSRIAALAAVLTVAATSAQAASETTRRNSNAIQNYQTQQQGPYYTGRTNPYYGQSTQPLVPQPNAASSNSLINQIRRNERPQGR